LSVKNNIQTKIPEIDALRGIAIILVVCHHTKSFWFLRDHPVFMENCWQSVNLFFILSGFSLAYPYLLNHKSLNSRQDVWQYYKKRSHRLFPLLLISSVIGVYFRSHFEHDAFIDLLYAISSFNIFTKEYFFPKVNDVLWSLSIEIWFSLFFVALLYVFRKKPLLTFVLFLIFSLGVRLYSINVITDYKYLNYVKDGFFGRIDDFIVGIFLCYIYTKQDFLKKIKWNIVYSVILMVLIYFITQNNFSIWYTKLKTNNHGYHLAFMNNYTHFIIILLMLFYFTMNKCLKFIFQNYFLRMLGRMSFSIYIWHSFLVELFYEKIGNIENSDALLLAKFWLLTLVISILTYRYIEFGHVNSWRKIFQN